MPGPRTTAGRSMIWTLIAAALLLITANSATPKAAAPQEAPADLAIPKRPATPSRVQQAIPVPVAPATRSHAVDPAKAQAERLQRIRAVKSWGYQLVGANVDELALTTFDLLVVDATAGTGGDRGFRPEDIARLKRKPDGSRRLVVSYLSIGEAEDYRPDYFTAEYMTEDAPDWLGKENPRWKGNRLVSFCHEGWQRTVLGDDQGRSVYNGTEPSPLYRLIELGFDGVYLDRVDVYAEVRAECPGGEKAMIDFVTRIAGHARKRDAGFLVIQQNAEELTRHRRLLDVIDALAKEDLFYGADHTEALNSEKEIRGALEHLKSVKDAGRPVFVVDYVISAAKKADARKRIAEQGFIPYIGPRDLGRIWLPGRDF